jgi:nucleoside-diphosphate-sugar epimerase
VLRQATVYGYSPRMRFDLAVNGMTYGAWKDGRAAADARRHPVAPHGPTSATPRARSSSCCAPREAIDGRVFNVGSEANNYQLGRLAEEIAEALPRDVRIEWYGDPDHRSYRVDFRAIEALGWKAGLTARDGAAEIYERLESHSSRS